MADLVTQADTPEDPPQQPIEDYRAALGTPMPTPVREQPEAPHDSEGAQR